MEYKQIEGNLVIYRNGVIMVGKYVMNDDENVTLSIETLSKIIKDAKDEVI